ncbi:MAG: hypothetical protein HZT43_03545 [Exiguobacterium profundum]|nr:MAG: hypothetical protein HZT43_03545 [Exiguobacterium profundum]
MTEETNDQELIEQGRFLALMRSNGHINRGSTRSAPTSPPRQRPYMTG